MMILNPKRFEQNLVYNDFDEITRSLLNKAIAFFEDKGLDKLKDDERKRTWYTDFLEFNKQEQLFAKFLTPAEYAGGDPDCRWDTFRISALSEILGFYNSHVFYCFQVSILGLQPIWSGNNEAAKLKAAKLLKEGAIFAYGLSERAHGADLYSTEMALAKVGEGEYLANGEKYYIGNGNEAEMVSTFGKMKNEEGKDDFVFFVSNFRNKQYLLQKNIIDAQKYVAAFKLEDYPVSEADILSKGPDAWDCALNTVNVGKFNVPWDPLGGVSHAFYETIAHASKRRLYNMYVTDFPHVQETLTEAFARLVAVRLYLLRAIDYMRSAQAEDRRYLLFNATAKMKTCVQLEETFHMLWSVIAAKGFEKDTHFSSVAGTVKDPVLLEGTVHVNIMLITKFVQNYMSNQSDFPEVPIRSDNASDAFIFNQGRTRGLGQVAFHDYRAAYDSFDLPNVNLMKEQIATFSELLTRCYPSESQLKDQPFMLCLGEIFTVVVYGHLILEHMKQRNIDNRLVDQVFEFMVKDMSKFALEMYNCPKTTAEQDEFCLKMIRKPFRDGERYKHVWDTFVYPLKDAYQMND